jgi:exosome complex exonuclease RRP6
VLDFPRHGLAQLLEMYCDVLPDKRYQTADWRIRPLPAEMLKYARMDTHYLLFIYDHLRGALLDRAKSPTLDGVEVSPFREVLARSAATAKRTHVREPYDPAGGGVGGWDALARKWNKAHLLAGAVHVPGSRCAAQKGVLGAVHAWRDKVAREEDESTRFVLPNHYLLQLAEQPPADMAALMRVFHPVPPVVRVRAKEIMDVIREAVREALGPQLPGAPVEAKEVSEPLIQVELAPEPMQVDSTAPSLWKAGRSTHLLEQIMHIHGFHLRIVPCDVFHAQRWSFRCYNTEVCRPSERASRRRARAPTEGEYRQAYLPHRARENPWLSQYRTINTEGISH